MVDRGLMDMDDPALAERLRLHKTNRARLTRRLHWPADHHASQVDANARDSAGCAETGPTEFRRAYLRTFVERVVVSRREVRISGPKSALARAASSGVPPPRPRSS